ncbi:MAG: hypothetical protein J6C03_03315 [Clostridia bacterium]|nr:hypothetical protein [Clostridia bacterium]
MNFKRILAVVLAAIMCLGVLASCNEGGGEETRPPEEQIGDANAGNFKQANYEGNKFTFLVIKHSDIIKDYYGGAFIDTEAMNGGKVNDAVFTRNHEVEQKYNVEIVEKPETNGDPAQVLQQFIMSGDFCFDVVYGWGYKLGACITENYLGDFHNLPDADFTQEYWSPSTINDLTVDERLYLSINEVTMNVLDWASFLFYNKTMAEDRNIEAEFGSPYDMVEEGTWTYDKFLKMVQGASADLDGDGSITRNDFFGLLDGDGVGTGALQNCGVYYTTKNDDGSYELSFYSEKTLGIIDMVHEVYSNDKYVKDFEDIWNEPGSSADGFDDQWQYARSYFATDHALFCGGSANITSEQAFRDMDSEYGVLPFPKYDVNQENYNATLDSNASVFALPSTERDDIGSWERTGIILEYMAYKSHEILLPAYYEEVLKGQRMDDDRDHKMLDIVRTNVHYELANLVNITSINDCIVNMFKKPAMAASTYTRNQKKMINELDDFYSKVIALD